MITLSAKQIVTMTSYHQCNVICDVVAVCLVVVVVVVEGMACGHELCLSSIYQPFFFFRAILEAVKAGKCYTYFQERRLALLKVTISRVPYYLTTLVCQNFLKSRFYVSL